MFPVRDDNPSVRTPLVTYALVLANAAVWMFFQGLGSETELARSVCELGLVPGELLGSAPSGTGVRIGRDAFCVVTQTPNYTSLVTSMFAHGGWMHIIGNMWFLWLFGDNVEDSMGHARFLAFYVLCGLGAAALQMATAPTSVVPMVGASGAIGGVMGAYVVLYPRVRIHMVVLLGFFITRVAVPAFFMLGYWFALQLLSASMAGPKSGGGGVAFWAHVGGFVSGAAMIFLFRNPKLVAQHPNRGWRRQRS